MSESLGTTDLRSAAPDGWLETNKSLTRRVKMLAQDNQRLELERDKARAELDVLRRVVAAARAWWHATQWKDRPGGETGEELVAAFGEESLEPLLRPVEVPKHDEVNHPAHYNTHPAGIECIAVVEHMPFNVGNVIEYLWRMDEKGAPIQDLEKAAWYLRREIDRRKAAQP